MTRSQFQPGAEKGHYHDSLGVDADIPGEQTIRLLGPYVFDFADAATFNQVQIAAFSSPGWVTKAWAITTVAWDFDGDGNATAGIDLFAKRGAGASFNLSGRWRCDATLDVPRWANRVADDTFTQFDEIVQVEEGDLLMAVFDYVDDPGEPTAGESEIYILIAEPSA